MTLKEYLDSLGSADAVADFARRCETAVGHLLNVAGGHKGCGAWLAVNIDRESKGEIRCEDLCDGVDWQYLRKSGRTRPRTVANLQMG